MNDLHRPVTSNESVTPRTLRLCGEIIMNLRKPYQYLSVQINVQPLERKQIAWK